MPAFIILIVLDIVTLVSTFLFIFAGHIIVILNDE